MSILPYLIVGGLLLLFAPEIVMGIGLLLHLLRESIWAIYVELKKAIIKFVR